MIYEDQPDLIPRADLSTRKQSLSFEIHCFSSFFLVETFEVSQSIPVPTQRKMK